MSSNKIIVEDGIIAGNIYNKYKSLNPISKYLVRNFLNTIEELLKIANPLSVHEVGCGEANLSIHLSKASPNISFRGSDFSKQVIEVASKNVQVTKASVELNIASIYELKPNEHSADLILCCEVLEHLEHPEKAIHIIKGIATPYLIVSVPREPMWRVLNMVRGKYIQNFGNTPGHIQHWSKHDFLNLLQSHLDILEVRSPLPWTVALCRSRFN